MLPLSIEGCPYPVLYIHASSCPLFKEITPAMFHCPSPLLVIFFSFCDIFSALIYQPLCYSVHVVNPCTLLAAQSPTTVLFPSLYHRLWSWTIPLGPLTSTALPHLILIMDLGLLSVPRTYQSLSLLQNLLGIPFSWNVFHRDICMILPLPLVCRNIIIEYHWIFLTL